MARVQNIGNPLQPIDHPADHVRRVALVPSDTVDIADPKPSKLFCCTAGTVTYLDKDGISRIVSVQIGQTLKGSFKRLMSTGTTSTPILRED